MNADEWKEGWVRELKAAQRPRNERGSVVLILYMVAAAVVWVGGLLYCSYVVQQANTPTCDRQAQDQ